MSIQTNQSLSVDCAVFGFNGTTLKVLLIERRYYKPDTRLDPLKLPGAMILENETLPEAAYRVLEEATGLKNVYLKQMEIFSDPNRVSGEELEWINRYHGIHSERVVTVGYYALVKLDSRMVAYTTAKGAQWVDVDSIQRLAMDHKQILTSALSVLCREMLQSPVAFELLPRKFTIRALQNLYSATYGREGAGCSPQAGAILHVQPQRLPQGRARETQTGIHQQLEILTVGGRADEWRAGECRRHLE